MRGFFVILLVLFAFALGFYYMTIYSTPIFLREITTTTITPTPTIYVSKLYPFTRYQDMTDGESPPTQGWIWYQVSLSKPPEGYKYFILTNLSKNNFNSNVWGCDMCSWAKEYVCYDGGYCDYEDICRPVNFEILNDTHTYVFTTYDFWYGLNIELVYLPERWDAVSNAWLVVVVVEENATLDQIMSNLYIA